MSRSVPSAQGSASAGKKSTKDLTPVVAAGSSSRSSSPWMTDLARICQMNPQKGAKEFYSMASAMPETMRALLRSAELDDDDIEVYETLVQDLLIDTPEGTIWMCGKPPAVKTEPWVTFRSMKSLGLALADILSKEPEEPDMSGNDFGDA